jgi:hypothetical protein
MSLLTPLDAFRLEPAVGPGAGSFDDYWRVHELSACRQDWVAMNRLRSFLVAAFGSAAVIRMTDDQVFAEISGLIRDGALKGESGGEDRLKPSNPGIAEEAPPPAVPVVKAKSSTPAAAPAPQGPPPPAKTGPAAAARIEAAQSGAPFWICCEECGY